jgi:hypothetical protein
MLLEAPMNSLVQITSNKMDLASISKVIHVLPHKRYFCPALLDNLVMHILKMKSEVPSKIVRQMAAILAEYSYHSKRLDGFVSLVMDDTQKEQGISQQESMVHSLWALAYLEYFPGTELSSVFTLEFMETMARIECIGKHNAVHTHVLFYFDMKTIFALKINLH